jgi:DNA-binding MarR family transcriptional regulator
MPEQPLPCACTSLRKGGRALSRLYDDALDPSGLRVTQYSLLATLARAGSLSLTALADELVMDRTTLSRNLLPLERAGLVHVAPGTDRRLRFAQLTPVGQERLEAARPLWRAAQDQVTEAFGRERLAALLTEVSAFVATTR